MRGFPSVAFTHSPRASSRRSQGAPKSCALHKCTLVQILWCQRSHAYGQPGGSPVYLPRQEKASQRQAKLSSPRTILCYQTCPGKVLIGMNWTVGLAKVKLQAIEMHGQMTTWTNSAFTLLLDGSAKMMMVGVQQIVGSKAIMPQSITIVLPAAHIFFVRQFNSCFS